MREPTGSSATSGASTGLPVRKALAAAKFAEPSHWSTAFVVYAVVEEADVEHALWLFRLSYDRRRGVLDAELVERVRAKSNA